MSLQVQSIFVSGVCGHRIPIFFLCGFHGMNVRCAHVLGSTCHLLLCVRARTSTSDHMQTGTPRVRVHHLCTRPIVSTSHIRT